ncbi:stalk domain-containing protein [Cohnella silvisoli]|uniref:Stalk domain-containing protein n=1 Tax=Cohnella silvisoli TaxID=2873699 RepID=A0ABV1KPT7_9BACL|nr:stalk domain-containing protein [Cohnella silvisoli]MCD9022365.1 hypothetical protein [Cohnella silvisoli]
MFSVVHSKRWLAFMLAAVLFFISVLSVSAADNGGKVEIRIKVGSNQMKINGAATKIQPPFQSAGNVMVPLSVFTNPKGFGANVKLKDNKIITLTYLKHVIVLTQGSKSAIIDGKKAALAVAPVIKQGVTMVPLTIIAKTFGATQAIDAATKEIVIKATAASSGSGSTGTGIDSDSGKSQIGDSYYKWSMNYPTGLVQQSQWSNGNWISFSDVKGEYFLALSIEEAEDTLETDDKRDLMTQNTEDDETVVDVKTITRPSGTFERMITKHQDGFYYEYRGIQANGYFYILIFGKKAKSASDLDANTGLLDSFKPVYNAANKSLKDLARIKDGKISFENEDYGLKLQLPKEWSESTEGSSPFFNGPDESYLLLNVFSINQDDTLDKWVERKIQSFKDNKAEAYRKTPETSSITWNGIPATLVKLSYSTDTKKWWNEYEIYAVNGKYKYYVDFTFKQEHKDDVGDVLSQLLDGMKIDFQQVEESFGQVPDPDDSVDVTATVTKTSKTYGYSLKLPKLWAKGISDMEKDSLHLTGVGTDLLVGIDEGTSLEGYPELLEKSYTDGGALSIDSKTNVTFAGVNAIKYALSSTKIAAIGAHSTLYLFENKGKIYLIQGILNDTFATELNRKLLEDAMNSFQFTK